MLPITLPPAGFQRRATRRLAWPGPCGESAAARFIGAAASQSLVREALLTPKPGLVDRDGPGAHRDMDLQSLLDSAAALEPSFAAFAEAGFRRGWDGLGAGGLPGLLAELRPAGIEAEAVMLRATGGVNSHKGAIFNLGLLAAGAGFVAGRGGRLPRRFDPDFLCGLAAGMCEGIVGRELETLLEGPDGQSGTKLPRRPVTAGEKAYASSGRAGARGEAASGFATLRAEALPLLRRAAARGLAWEPAAREALLRLIAHCEDSCLLKRGGEEGLAFAQNAAKKLVDRHGAVLGYAIEELELLRRQFIARSLSPGGSADLLAAGLFLVELEYPGWR